MKSSFSRLVAASTLALLAATGNAQSHNQSQDDLSNYTTIADDARFNICSKDNHLVQVVVTPATPRNQPVTTDQGNAYLQGLLTTLSKHIFVSDKTKIGYPDNSFQYLRVQMATFSQLFNAQNKTALKPLFPRFYVSEAPSAECIRLNAPKTAP